jgi:hypothetical protein
MAAHIEDALAWCLEAIEKGRLTPRECRHRFPEHDPELTNLLDLATALRASPQGMTSIGFRLRARSRMKLLIHERGIRPAPQPPARQPSRAGFPRLRRQARSWGAALTAVVMLLGTTSGALAAADSLPGDLLYPAKLLFELTQESLTTDPARQAALHLRLAERRMQETAALIEAGRLGDLDQALANLELHLALAGGSPPVSEREGPAHFAHHIEVLRGLLERLPAQARPALERVVARAEVALQNGGPGRSGDAPGQQPDGHPSGPEDLPPGLVDNPGNGPEGGPPGQQPSGEPGGTPGNSPEVPPGQSGEHGPPATPPGQSRDRGRPETPPGRDKKP